MAAAITDLLDRVTDSATGRPVISALAGTKAIGAPSLTLSDATNWTTSAAIHFSIYTTVTVGGVTVKDPTSQTDWKGVLTGSTISSLTITGGTDRSYNAGAIVEITPTARYAKDLYDWAVAHANQDGSLKSSAVQTALGLGASSLNGWLALGFAPNSVACNGNRSYDLTFNGTDLSATLSAGMRLRTQRTVAAPNQCTSLNGTTNYYSKAAPAGMTFTDDFVVGAWVKLTAYSASLIASRYNGTSGWRFGIDVTGRLSLEGYNGGAANISYVQSYASIPLNRWVYVTAQLDMSAFTATPTTSYIMFDGVDTPAFVGRGGTNPVALVQAGSLEIGSNNGGTNLLTGKIAQLAIFSAKVTQATILGYLSQTLAGTETSLISAYSFNNTINDLNTTNANNLTANGSAVATNADSPFGSQADGTISTTLDYAIIQKVTFSTNTVVTVQVPEGGTIPTSGGVSTVVYTSNKAPFGMPISEAKWQLIILKLASESVAIGSFDTFTASNHALTVPVGAWRMNTFTFMWQNNSVANIVSMSSGIGTSPSAVETESKISAYSGVACSDYIISLSAAFNLALTAATVYRYYHYTNSGGGGGTITGKISNGVNNPSFIRATNAYL
jgi:hypothetical protein